MQTKQTHINELLRQCELGVQSAQLEIYNRYYKAMYNSALRILNDSFEAEDVMQESFLVAFTKLSTFKKEVAFGAWLKRIVINRSLTQLKKKSRVDEVSLEIIPDTEDEEMEDSNYTTLKAKEIVNTIGQLKDNYRVALTLNLIEGYDYEEVAEIMKITYQNSRTTISRAKEKLRKLLVVSYEG